MRLALALVALLSVHAHSRETRGRSLESASILQGTESFAKVYDGGRDFAAPVVGYSQPQARASALELSRAAKPRSAMEVPPIGARIIAKKETRNIPLTGGLLLAMGWGAGMGVVFYRARPLKKGK